jgi:hypothetical protein
MYSSRLELPAARGDETLSAVRFVLRAVTSSAAGADIFERGLGFVEGEGFVSTNLAQADRDAAAHDGPGMIVAVATAPDFHLGYAVHTTAYIDRTAKLVMGAPLRYAAARKQLAFYMDADTEVARRRVELEMLSGQPLASRPTFQIPKQYIVGGFPTTAGLRAVLTGLKVSAKAFEAVDSANIEQALVELFDCREPAQAALVPGMMRSLVVGTIESVIMSRLRMMRWQGLGLLGYHFHEGREDVAVTRVEDMAEQRRRIGVYERLLTGANVFIGELAWLKVYALHELNIMRVELDGAELGPA